MRNITLLVSVMVLCAGIYSFREPWPSTTAHAAESLPKIAIAPEFTHTNAEEWINSKPLELKKLRGKVVLVNFWTFACWNCYRSFPWLNSVYKTHQQKGLEIVAVHSPEFERERDTAAVKRHVAKHKLKFPVMIDNDYSYWRSLDNRYWPTFYLIGKGGKIRAQFSGETHQGDSQAKRIGSAIQQLLEEKIE